MDIAAMSMQLSSSKIQQSAGLSVAKKAMDNQEVQAADLLKMMDAAVPNQIKATGLGQYVDVRV
ncbi:YjfB family protein [Lacrimispora defluvii]|uniref:Motility protein n=1 Tax=Lacrimispora defluvii TaxID=2719233 RepID=A0ABX1VS70_9FIRM|nr:YjfB family protein [Lacrimispora defluvii]NNJ31188.1 putative motility protein [Lacrimispora defluvii]